MYFFMLASLSFLAGLIVNGIIRNNVNRLVRDAKEMGDSQNDFLKQIKRKYENSIKIGRKIPNTEAFVGKFMERFAIGGIGLRWFEKLSAVCCGLCMIFGICGALYDRGNAVNHLLVGFLAMYIVEGTRKLIDVTGKKESAVLEIVDYFDNARSLAAKESTVEADDEEVVFGAEHKKVMKSTDSVEERKLIDDILREYLG